MNKLNRNYLNMPLYRAENERRSVENTLALLNKLRKNPVVGYVIFALILTVTQILSSAGLVNSSFVYAIGSTLIFCVVSLGFCLLLGYSALASLGTAGFIGIGAYCTYYCLAEWGLTIGVAFIMSIVIALIVGAIVGYISLRIEGIYLAIVTLGISQIIKEVLAALVDTIKIKGSQITLFGIDSLKLKTESIFYIIVGMMLLLMIITHNIMNSPTGRAMLAMKNSTSAAQAFGISLMKYRLLAFMISIIYAAIAGMLFMLYNRYVSNSSSTLFTLSTSLNILGAVIIGGMKSIWGTVAGTFIIYGIDKMFLQDIEFFRENPTLITLFCGILVVVVIMFYPGGLAQLLMEVKYKVEAFIRKKKEGKYGKDLG
ncbi:MAG: branched-chain amino acid ABC transporter permease [Clostridia bacterium]|nr:branched-chain amino acid ABC transporter permease [Clostridia bacterium]